MDQNRGSAHTGQKLTTSTQQNGKKKYLQRYSTLTQDSWEPTYVVAIVYYGVPKCR